MMGVKTGTLAAIGMSGVLAAGSAAAETGATPPVAARIPYDVPSPNGTRVDPYYWLRDDTRSKPAVLDYLKAENAYTEAAFLKPTAALRETLFQEIVGRIRQNDSSVPVRRGEWWYYSRYSPGNEYPIHARKHLTLEAPEEVLLDGPALAKGHDFFSIADVEPSPDGAILAFTEDTVGRRQYVLHFRDLKTGKVLADAVANVEPGVAWASDNKSVLYVEKDPVTLLSTRIRKHVLGSDPSQDPVLYEEADKSFYLGIARSKSGRFLYLVLSSTLTDETRYADADDPSLTFRPVLPRETDLKYDVEDFGDDFIIRTNWQAENFRIVRAPIKSSADKTTWRDIVPHDPKTLIGDFDVTKAALAVSFRAGGQKKIGILPWGAAGGLTTIAADEPDPALTLVGTMELDAPVRYVNTSLVTPSSTYDYDVTTGKRTLLKRDEVPAYDPAKYETAFVFAPARDGTPVPVSLLYRKDLKRDGTAPLFQAAYGSYGISSDPSFGPAIFSLVDRGFVYAIAHIRGGQEMGRAWYLDGRLQKKRNSFTDFIDVTQYLVARHWVAGDKVFARGGSAGGLLMGAVANMAPATYRGIIAHVPFVDVVTTMLDESIPLTTNEFDEWGNPKQKAAYDTMLAYSPYDNVTAQRYPALYVTTGLWDSQVQYYEPAKWVAKLRATAKPDSGPLYFKINMEAGHGGKSGRYEYYREVAEDWAFVLDQLGEK
jgi:oligopeptidase B